MVLPLTIDMTQYINRGVEILLANVVLRDPGIPADSLVTDVLAQEPPVEQAPNASIIPVIYCWYSRNPIRQTDQIGRNSLNAAGAKVYHVEFYNVIIARGISKQNALENVQAIAEVVKDTYQKNLRLGEPGTFNNILAIANEVTEVPFVLRSPDPLIQAINVMVRATVPVDLT